MNDSQECMRASRASRQPSQPNTGDSAHRPIRSFVIREGRLTPAQQRALRELWPRFGVERQPGDALDLRALFGNAHPVHLEIGFGNGEALLAQASSQPQLNFLGIEVHRPGVGHLLLEVEKRGLTNLRVCRQDAVEVLEQGLAAASLAEAALLFPDPWPKKRHHKRRILTPQFARLIGTRLRPGGLFHAATDCQGYAEQMLGVLTAAGDLFENTAAGETYCVRPQRPVTKFEQRALQGGHPVWNLLFRRR